MILSVLIAGVSNRMGKDERQAALKRIEIQRYEKEKQGWNRDIRLVLMPLGLSIVGILCAGTACYLLSGTERKTKSTGKYTISTAYGIWELSPRSCHSQKKYNLHIDNFSKCGIINI